MKMAMENNFFAINGNRIVRWNEVNLKFEINEKNCLLRLPLKKKLK